MGSSSAQIGFVDRWFTSERRCNQDRGYAGASGHRDPVQLARKHVFIALLHQCRPLKADDMIEPSTERTADDWTGQSIDMRGRTRELQDGR
jgi:hypothetical protein